MAINIQSLFSDIIETPAQRQERMLTEGILRGRELTSGLTGLARTQAPLVSALSMQMPQRQEALRRGVGGMLGLDVRTESEKLQDILRQADTSTPTGMINLSRAIQSIAPAQAITLRQAAIEEQQRLADRERQTRLQDLQIEEAKAKIGAMKAESLAAPERIRTAASIVANTDPDFASAMQFLYAGDPEGAVKIAEQYAAGVPDENIRNQKIRQYTDMLIRNGQSQTEQEANDLATRIVDGMIQITPDPNNPTRATLTDRVARTTEVISSTPATPVVEGETLDDAISNMDAPSILEMLQETTGTWNRATEILGRAAEGITGWEGLTDQKKTEYVQGLKAIENTVIRAFSLNDRYPIGEQDRIREQIAFKPEFLTGPEAAAARVAAVDNFMNQEIIAINQRLANPETPPDQRAQDIILMDSINAYRDKLYPRAPSVGALTVDVINNMTKDRVKYFVENIYSLEDLGSLSEEVRNAIAQKLR